MLQSFNCNSGAKTGNLASVSHLAIIALIAFTLVGEALAQDTSRPTATFELKATELEIDEGGVVEFFIEDKAYRNPETGEILPLEADLSPFTWDFADGRAAPAEDYGLEHIRHWFADDNQGAPYTVTASHQGTEKQIQINVRNVLPTIYGVQVTEQPRPGKPTLFQAVARDPGYTDELTFEWDLGDGTTKTGRIVKHTYASEGNYPVTLIVTDEEGTQGGNAGQGGSFTVTVSDDRDTPDENTISVGGAISETDVEITGVTIAGSNGNPMNPSAGGACQVRLEMRTDRDGMMLTLTASLAPGLTPGNYTVGRTNEWDGMHQDDAASLGTFFGDFAPPRNKANRDFGGRRIGGPFWSDHGRVSISRFDSGVLELDFDLALTENVPGTFDPRQVRVRGMLSTTLDSVAGSGDTGGGAELASGLAGLLAGMNPSGRNVSAYLCPGEEPEEFELIASSPGPNEISAKYEDTVVELLFSQAVHSDSTVNPDNLHENLEIYYPGSDGQKRHPNGGWIVPRQNPSVVQFVPQARLLPGTVYCVYVNRGEEGLRSFGGKVLGGSSLEAPSDEMARACPPAGENRLGFTFSTRPELESVWVDVYHGSLAGPHAEIWNDDWALARVYAWWQNAWNDIHPDAQVREFPAYVHAVQDRRAMRPLEVGQSPQSASPIDTKIKRPDLYSDGERSNMDHTAEFRFYDLVEDMVETEIAAVIQMRSRHGQAVDPVFPSPATRYSERRPINQFIRVYDMNLRGFCSPERPDEQCTTWAGRWSPAMVATANQGRDQLWRGGAQDLLPNGAIFHTGLDYALNVTEPCPDNFQAGGCYGEGPADAASEPGIRYLQLLAAQIIRDYSDRTDYDPRTDILLVYSPPGLLPDPDTRPAILFLADFPSPSVIFVQVDRMNDVALTRMFAKALLDEEACNFDGSSFCDLTPVQGVRRERMDYAGYNKHHVEGNGESGRLIPLLKEMPYDAYNERDFHISAYNWGKLYEAIKRRYDYANGASPDS